MRRGGAWKGSEAVIFIEAQVIRSREKVDDSDLGEEEKGADIEGLEQDAAELLLLLFFAYEM